MLNLLKARIHHGRPFIADPQRANAPDAFVGWPKIDDTCCDGCGSCQVVCPTGAITTNPLKIDLGKCIFCSDCQRLCPREAIRFTNFHRTACQCRQGLIVGGSTHPDAFERDAIQAREELRAIFGRSLKLRQVSAGGCNGCEMELGACGNVNFDMGRYGIEFVASPRHADAIVLTGPVTGNMAAALIDAYLATPEPKLIIAVGACAISGGLFAGSPAIDRSFFEGHPVDLYVPGCPPHPLTFITGVLWMLGR